MLGRISSLGLLLLGVLVAGCGAQEMPTENANQLNRSIGSNGEASAEVPFDLTPEMTRLCADLEGYAGFGLSRIMYEANYSQPAYTEIMRSTEVALLAIRTFNCDARKVANEYVKIASGLDAERRTDLQKFLEGRSDIPKEEKQRLLDALP